MVENILSAGPAGEASEEGEARGCLSTLPGFTAELAASARLERLVGFTNRVFKVEVDSEALCLRIPGSGAAALVDRRAEAVNARLAANAGVAPDVVYSGDDGTMLTRFVENALPLSPAHLQASDGALQRSAGALRRLHDAPIAFANAFDAFAFIEAYVAVLTRLGLPLTDVQQRTVARALAVRPLLAARAVTPRPCHCDPTGRNLLDTGERVWLIDWEYSGMNDPMFDIAYFSSESRLDASGDRALMAAYFGGGAPQAEAARMTLLKPVCEVLAGLWALIQIGEGNSTGDFRTYAERSFAEASAHMSAAVFEESIGLLR